jgi:hypothetical protein
MPEFGAGLRDVVAAVREMLPRLLRRRPRGAEAKRRQRSTACRRSRLLAIPRSAAKAAR